MRRREVDHLRAALTDVHNVTAGFRESLRECVADRRPRETDVVSDRHLLRAKQRGETASDAVSELLVYLIRIDTAYIVCAKTFVCHCHVTSPPPRDTPRRPIHTLYSPFDQEPSGHNKTLYNRVNIRHSFLLFLSLRTKSYELFLQTISCTPPPGNVFPAHLFAVSHTVYNDHNLC